MRRLHNAGIVLMVLLGLTGCAGVQQRLGWTEPPYRGDEDEGERPLSRLAFWRRPQAESDGSAAPASGDGQQARAAVVADGGASGDDADERPGLLRRLPALSRLWKHSDRDEDDPVDRPASRYMATPFTAATTAFAPPSRPGAATAFASPSRPAGAASSPAPATVDTANAAGSAPASTAAAQARRSDDEPTGELALDVSGARPEVDAAAVPAGHDGPTTSTAPPASQDAAEAVPPVSGSLAFGPQQNATTPAPAAAPGGSVPPPPSIGGPGQPLGLPSDVPTVSGDMPILPAPTIGGQLSSTPGTSMPTVVSAPTWSADQSTLVGSGQMLVTTSSQSGVISSGCDEPCGKKCNPIHKLCPLKKHRQASAVVYPSAQGGISSCQGTCKVKKPCFLKTWLHHKSGCKAKGCKGCKSCSYCGEAPVIVSGQDVVTSSQQY